MTLVEKQLEILRGKYPTSSARQLPSGASLIEIQNVSLPPGWNRQQVTVYFIASPGYPAAQPDCFWTDEPFLRLANNPNPPQNTNESNPIPEVGMKGTWFSWHLQSWNPNRDSLLTYLNVIIKRFDSVQ